MRAVIQHVLRASVTVDNEVVGSVGRGLCVLVGICRDDVAEDVDYIIRKILNTRLFSSQEGKRWDKSVKDMELEVLCISQFTLFGVLKGNTLDFHTAMSPDKAEPFYKAFLEKMRKEYQPEKIQDGRFGAMMQVDICNDGPVTITIDTYSWARDFRVRHPLLGWLVHLSFNIGIALQLAIFFYHCYAYIHIVCFDSSNLVKAIVYSSVFVVLASMTLWSLARTIFAIPFPIPDRFKVNSETDEKPRNLALPVNPEGDLDDQIDEARLLLRAIAKGVGRKEGIIRINETDEHGRYRYCYSCRLLKPDRARHCSSCGFCTLRFDHHCPYINSCIAFHNYKFFVLYLLYSTVYLLWLSATSLEVGIRSYLRGDLLLSLNAKLVHISLLVVPTFVFLILAAGDMLQFHVGLMLDNETTCDQWKTPVIRGDPDASFNLGWRRNLELVLGTSWWLLPIWTMETDGVEHDIQYQEATDENDDDSLRY